MLVQRVDLESGKPLIDLILALNMANSKSDARRLIRGEDRRLVEHVGQSAVALNFRCGGRGGAS